jgi:hypothetical protein
MPFDFLGVKELNIHIFEAIRSGAGEGVQA